MKKVNFKIKWVWGAGLLIVVGGFILGLSLYINKQALRETAETQNLLEARGLKKQQVKRVFLKRWVGGKLEYTEILANGDIRVYDEKMNLIRQGKIGIARVRSLFDDIENRLKGKPGNIGGGGGDYEIIVETEEGTTVIGGGGGDSDWDDIVDDIDQIDEQEFAPTPTLIPSPTFNPQATVTPYPTLWPSQVINPTPTFLPGTPTPLPAYMTAPPFTCEDYNYLNRPIFISNVVCNIE